jgi:hypothetical protein
MTTETHGYPGGQEGLLLAGVFLLCEVLAIFSCAVSFASLLKQSHAHLALSFSGLALVLSSLGLVVFVICRAMEPGFSEIPWDNPLALFKLMMALLALPMIALFIHLVARRKSK